MSNTIVMGALLLGAGCAVPAPEVGSELLKNGSFDAWCSNDDVPCDWNARNATVEQTTTWSRYDHGISFVGPGPGSLVQQVDLVDQSWREITCLEGEVLVRGEPDLWLDLDFAADGVVEWSRQIPGGRWHLDTFRFQPPRWFERFEVALRVEAFESESLPRHNVGHVRLRATPAEDCDPVESGEGPGFPCQTEAHCTGSTCEDVSDIENYWSSASLYADPLVCSTCAVDADCDPVEVCGAAWGRGPQVARACVPRDSVAWGEICSTDDQCATGTCCHGRCSECCEAGCPGDALVECRPRLVEVVDTPRLIAHVCESAPRGPGEACLSDRDCLGTCLGEPLSLCVEDGRGCTSDTNCRGRVPGSCVAVGVRDGTCD